MSYSGCQIKHCDMAFTNYLKTFIWNQDILKGMAQRITKWMDFLLFGHAHYDRKNWNSCWDQVLSHYGIQDSHFDTCFQGRYNFHVFFQGSGGLHIAIFQGRQAERGFARSMMICTNFYW